jgi:hypothetical protein
MTALARGCGVIVAATGSHVREGRDGAVGMGTALESVVVPLFDVCVWLAIGLLAGVVIGRRRLGATVLASSAAAFAFGAMARIANGHGWSDPHVDKIAMAAAVIGAMLGAIAMRSLMDSAPSSQKPHSR